MKFSPENLEIFALQKKTEDMFEKIKSSDELLHSELMGKLGPSLSKIVEMHHEFL